MDPNDEEWLPAADAQTSIDAWVQALDDLEKCIDELADLGGRLPHIAPLVQKLQASRLLFLNCMDPLVKAKWDRHLGTTGLA